MALTLRSNGNNPINIVTASWFNDFYNLLTGAMNDQPVSLKYTPASGTTPALTLTSKAGNPLLKGFQPDGVTQAFLVDENGNITAAGSLTLAGLVRFGASVSGSQADIDYEAATNSATMRSPAAGATPQGIRFVTWNGSSALSPFSIGGQMGGALAWVDNSGNLVTTGFLLVGPAVSGSQSQIFYSTGINALQLSTPQAGATALGISFGTWTGSASKVPFSIGGPFNGALAWVDNAGTFDSPVGLNWGAGVPGAQSNVRWDNINKLNTYWTPQGGSANQHLLITWNGSAQVNLFSVGGTFGASSVDSSGHFNDNGNAVPYTKSAGGGAAGRVIWVGTTDPGVNASEGDIWIQA